MHEELLPYAPLLKLPVLAPEEELELIRKIEAGDERARQTLVNHHTRLVAKIAVRCAKKYRFPIGDLMQEGFIGLLQATKKHFDPCKGRFATYAYKWILESMMRPIQEDYPLNVPRKVPQTKLVVRDMSQKLQQELERTPSTDEIFEAVRASGRQCSRGDVERALLELQTSYVSLNAEITGNTLQTYSDRTQDTSRLNPEEALLAREEFVQSQKFVDALCSNARTSERNKDIFRKRFGLDGTGEQKTLDALHKEHNVSIERIRQIVDRVLEKARLSANDAPGTQAEMREYLENIDRLEELIVTSA